MPDRFLRVELGRNRRLIAISDIHADLPLFRRLLSSFYIRPEDVLVLVGDYINRGPDSLGTIRFIRELSHRPNTYVLKGNIERLGEWYLRRGDKADIVPHFSDHVHNLFCEWAAESGYPRVGLSNFDEVRAVLAEKYGDEAAFLRELPYGLETEDFIFVHSGICQSKDYRDSSEQELLKNDAYLSHGPNNTGKWVVVGHTPVWNDARSGSSNGPLIMPERKIIGIDGGCSVKSFAQLNALVIDVENGVPMLSSVFADASPLVAVRHAQRVENEPLLKAGWPDYNLELLERGAEFSRCRLTGSGAEGLVKNEHFERFGGGYRYAVNSTSNFLSAAAGEQLYLLDDCGGWLLAKNAVGELGWIPKKAVEP